MTLLASLNEKQKAAVCCSDKHVRIIAGAGSGKTRVITTRIAYLIEEMQVWPNRILAITFTNKAAREMKERIESLLDDRASGVFVSTIHSFCVRLLREDIYELKYPRNFTIIDTDDAKSILKEAYKIYDLDIKQYSYTAMMSYISNCKMQFVSPQDALKLAHYAKDEARANVYEYYQNRLQQMYALDFDDLLLYAYRLLNDFEHVRRKWQRRFDYIHVDEFQDVDYVQYQIISLITAKDSKLCVVGDPDQTIYTWRGARVDIILNFENDFKNCETIILNENYRSTQPILNAANALIKHNKNRIDKDLFTKCESDDLITHYSAIDDNDEPRWVAGQIAKLMKEDVKCEDIAVLYRSNYLSRGLEKEFMFYKIPYIIYGGIRFYDRQEIKDALSYLRLLVNDENDEKAYAKDLAIKRIINTPKRGIGEKGMENLERYAKEHQCNLYDAIKYSNVLKGKAKTNANELVKVIEECSALSDDLAIDLLLDKVLKDSGYLKMLEDDKEVERIENIKSLIEDMNEYMEEHMEASLNDYLQEISLYTDKEQNQNMSAVKLMTIHAAKGLEFDHVFVYNLCDGVFPSERSLNEGGNEALEEERRLAYVAFTRAKKHLYLSNSSGYSYVLDRVKLASRFFKELPAKYILKYGEKKQDVKQEVKMKLYDFKANVNKTRSKKWRKGDIVHHDSFGDGKVLQVEDNLLKIDFGVKYGVRKIMASHPSLHKKG